MSSGPEGLAKVSKFFSELYNLSNALFNSRVPSYFMNDGLTCLLYFEILQIIDILSH